MLHDPCCESLAVNIVSCTQFPLWEFFKKTWSKYLGKRRKIYSYESALCGSAAGGKDLFFTSEHSSTVSILCVYTLTIYNAPYRCCSCFLDYPYRCG